MGDVWLLEGNQSRKVSWMRKNKSSVKGYRWPEIVGDFPAEPAEQLWFNSVGRFFKFSKRYSTESDEHPAVLRTSSDISFPYHT